MRLNNCHPFIVIVQSVAVACALASPQASDFRFSTIYGDHMVLQQAPNQANLWGYTPDCEDQVTVHFDDKDYQASVIKDASEILIVQ